MKRIDDFSNDFAKMLSETLNNMRDKIASANEKWQNENDGTQATMQQRFNESAGK